MNFSHLTNYVVALGFCLFLALELVFLQACISLAYDALYLRKLASLFLYPHLDRGLFVVTLRALKFLRHLTGPKFSVLHATSRTLICPQPSAGIPRQPTPSFFKHPFPGTAPITSADSVFRAGSAILHLIATLSTRPFLSTIEVKTPG